MSARASKVVEPGACARGGPGCAMAAGRPVREAVAPGRVPAVLSMAVAISKRGAAPSGPSAPAEAEAGDGRSGFAAIRADPGGGAARDGATDTVSDS